VKTLNKILNDCKSNIKQVTSFSHLTATMVQLLWSMCLEQLFPRTLEAHLWQFLQFRFCWGWRVADVPGKNVLNGVICA